MHVTWSRSMSLYPHKKTLNCFLPPPPPLYLWLHLYLFSSPPLFPSSHLHSPLSSQKILCYLGAAGNSRIWTGVLCLSYLLWLFIRFLELISVAKFFSFLICPNFKGKINKHFHQHSIFISQLSPCWRSLENTKTDLLVRVSNPSGLVLSFFAGRILLNVQGAVGRDREGNDLL